MEQQCYSVHIYNTEQDCIFSGYFVTSMTEYNTCIIANFYDWSQPKGDTFEDIHVNTQYNDEQKELDEFDNITNMLTNWGTKIDITNNEYFKLFDVSNKIITLSMIREISNNSQLKFVINYMSSNNILITHTNYNICIKEIPKLSCLNKGTNVLCLDSNFNDVYIPIENLTTGSIVKTYKYGYRKITMIGSYKMSNNSNNYFDLTNKCMFLMPKLKTNSLFENLIVTNGQTILVDNLYADIKPNTFINDNVKMIDDKYLLEASMSYQFIKQNNNKQYTCYFLTLENNNNDDEQFGIWANGVLVATLSKNQFIKHTNII